MDVFVKHMFLEIPRKIIGVLYEQNKSNETIQRYESDTVINPTPMDDMSIDIWFISSINIGSNRAYHGGVIVGKHT